MEPLWGVAEQEKTRDTPHFSLVAALRSLVLYKYWGVSLVFRIIQRIDRLPFPGARAGEVRPESGVLLQFREKLLQK
jgi:hypothetical protein